MTRGNKSVSDGSGTRVAVLVSVVVVVSTWVTVVLTDGVQVLEGAGWVVAEKKLGVKEGDRVGARVSVGVAVAVVVPVVMIEVAVVELLGIGVKVMVAEGVCVTVVSKSVVAD